jgi:hypothetical protein
MGFVSQPDDSVIYFRIFERRIKIHCEDDLFRGLLLANYQAMQDSAGQVDLEYRVERHAEQDFSIFQGEETVVQETGSEAPEYFFVYLSEKLLTLELQSQRTDLYFVHASVLERGGRAIMIIAESGTGKSTTSWALLQHGFHYLSDELAPIDPHALTVLPYPHALCLKSEPPGPYPLPQRVVRTERTLHIPVTSLPSPEVTTPQPLAALVFLRRTAELSEPECDALSSAEASTRLYANTLNALAHPDSGLDAAIRIAGAVPAFIVDAGNLHATCELISTIERDL